MQPITLVRGIELPSLDQPGTKDLWIVGGRIFAIADAGEMPREIDVQTEIDGSHLVGLPGLVDPHIHILGGGGGTGYESYVDGPVVEDLLKVGITSLVGSLGFDSTTRTLPALVRKAKALGAGGIGVRCLVGGFNFPPLTVTGDIRQDMVVVTEVVGAGELALGDSRGAHLTDTELAGYAGMCFTGAMLSGKPAILQIHLGDDPAVFERVARVARSARLPASMFHMTHVNRNRDMMEASVQFGKNGGLLDITTHLPQAANGPIPAAEAVTALLNAGVPDTQITVSTDGFGGMRVDDRPIARYVPSPVSGLLDCLLELWALGMPVSQAVKFVSTNAARYFGLVDRGLIEEGASADILLLDNKTRKLVGVILAGNLNGTPES